MSSTQDELSYCIGAIRTPAPRAREDVLQGCEKMMTLSVVMRARHRQIHHHAPDHPADDDQQYDEDSLLFW